MSDWLLFILIVLAIYRITRLIISDTFPPFGIPRLHLINYWYPDSEWLVKNPDAKPHWGSFGYSLRYLFTCPWCMSVWVGAVLIPVVDIWYDVPAPWLVWAAGSALTGLMSGIEEKLS